MGGLSGLIGGIIGTATGIPGGTAIGSALGSAFGGGGDDNEQQAAATAAAAPTQTTLQKNLSPLAEEKLKGWLGKPPKVSSSPLQMTGISVGGNKFGYTPGKTTQIAGVSPSAGTVQQQPGLVGQPLPPNVRANPTQASVVSTPETPVDNTFQSPGQQFQTTPAQINIPDLPVSEMTYGKEGTFQQGTDRFSDLQGSTTDQFKDLPLSTTDRYSGLAGGLVDQYGNLPTSVENVYADLPTSTQDRFSGLAEGLTDRFGDLASGTQDRFSDLQTGFDQNYLNTLASSEMNPLNEAFKLALGKADANAARTGMAGSGYAQNQKFGQAPGTVTRNYLDRASEVAKQVELAGAQAQREDAYRKAGLLSGQDLSNVGIAKEKAQLQAGADLTNANLSTDKAKLLSGQDLTNANMAMTKADKLNAYNLGNVALATDKAKLLGGQDLQSQALAVEKQKLLGGQDVANADRFTTAAKLRAEQDINNANRAAEKQKLLSTQDQTNEANRQWWANTLTAQRQSDNQARTGDWNNALGLGKYLTGREDDNAQRNQALDLQLQSDNIGYQRNALADVMAMINGQNNTASLANKNYWGGVEQGNLQNAGDNSAMTALVSALTAAQGGRNNGTVGIPDLFNPDTNYYGLNPNDEAR